jgi:hypothetical protein
MAGFTMGTPFILKPQFNKLYFAKQSIEGTKGTCSPTKRSAGQYGPDNKKNEEKKLIDKKQA